VDGGGEGGERPGTTPMVRLGRTAHRRELSWRLRRWRRRGAALAALGEKGSEGVGADRDGAYRVPVQGSRRGDGPARGHRHVGATVRGGSA
jgi:hypothetical protein